MINRNRVPSVNNIGLAVAGILPSPPLYSNDAKLLLSLSKLSNNMFTVSIISTGLFWSVIKSYEFIVTTNFVQCKR